MVVEPSIKQAFVLLPLQLHDFDMVKLENMEKPMDSVTAVDD